MKKFIVLCLLAGLALGLCACLEPNPDPEPTTAQTTTQVEATTEEWLWDGREIPVDQGKIVVKDMADHPEFLDFMAEDWVAGGNKPLANSYVRQVQESYLDHFYRIRYAAFPDFRDELTGPGAAEIKAHYERRFAEAQAEEVLNSLFDCDTVEAWEQEACHFSVRVYAVETFEPYLSVNYLTYYYGGGAHGNESKYADVFDLRTGKLLDFGDIVPASAYDTINALVEDYLREYDIEPWEPFDVRESPPSSFRAEKDGFVIIYNPYEIASYADGIIEVKVPFGVLGG